MMALGEKGEEQAEGEMGVVLDGVNPTFLHPLHTSVYLFTHTSEC